ncbi:DNA alkylation repair protein [Patescibacteria group bacterium]|nr:DNA alkylation repair protein [Patescibacteria group bacterium]
MNSNNAQQVKEQLYRLRKPEKAAFFPRFFKTGPGQYGEGDQFIGVVVPDIRNVSKASRTLSEKETLTLLSSPIHEERMVALFIMIEQFQRGTAAEKKRLHQLYLHQSRYVNNWDLVDLSARVLIGEYLAADDISLLRRLAKSSNLWEQRMAILATFAFILQGNSEPTLEVAEMLVNHPHDLIQKAVGWLLREVGKRNSLEVEKAFLDKHAKQMPRTMLRYAIERFPETDKKHYMQLKFTSN